MIGIMASCVNAGEINYTANPTVNGKSSDVSGKNLMCLVNVEVDHCYFLRSEADRYPFVVIHAYDYIFWETNGAFGHKMLEGINGGLIILINFQGSIFIEPLNDNNGGSLTGYCYITSATLY
jgi:hypothetical protein